MAERNVQFPMSKKAHAARLARLLGLLALLERRPKRAGILVLNHHRVTDPRSCPYDHGVIDSTPEQFEWQIRWLQRHFRVLTLEEVEEAATGGRPIRDAGALITFDDGYIDNYQVAFPILKSLGVPGTFFLATSYVGSSCAPWWDAIAYRVRRSPRNRIRLEYPRVMEFELVGDREAAIASLLRLYKSPEVTDPPQFLAALSDACGCAGPEDSKDPLFLNWEQAAEMVRCGMSIGSHTHTHELLAKLAPEAQYEELRHSRDLLQKRLGITVGSLAFPVGSPSSFSAATREALQQAGYRVAFSYYGGVNFAETLDPYNLLRIGVERSTPRDLFRLRTTLAAAGRQF
jgi:peptidoglycan/xylan/chitin deacetylase (PgdA/CDA1 family)